jgi:uncharacterized protein (TIGR02145 family)
MITLIVIMTTGCRKNEEIPDTITDVDGNVYHTIIIATQVWLKENLKTTRYGNGDPIPEITGQTEWLNLNSGAHCKYDNNLANASVYGLLYNWYAVQDPRNVCPAGWRAPTYDDWAELVDFLGGESIAGDKMKQKGTSHWISPNAEATDNYGFTALPAGYRLGGAFEEPGHYAIFWSSTEEDAADAWMLNLTSSSGQAYLEDAYKSDGFSVRCIKE